MTVQVIPARNAGRDVSPSCPTAAAPRRRPSYRTSPRRLGKQIVHSLLERGSHIRVSIIPNTKTATMERAVREHVEVGTAVYRLQLGPSPSSTQGLSRCHPGWESTTLWRTCRLKKSPYLLGR